MPLDAIDNRRLYRQIADQLTRYIESEDFQVGSRLPAERELAERFGVSRPTVREALIALEVEGLVEVKVGSGVHVLDRPRPKREAHPAVPPPGPFDVIKARYLIESEAAALAASNATADHLQAMKTALAQMRSMKTHGAEATAADERFHMAIAEASGNAALVMVIHQLWEQRTSPLYMQLESHFTGETIWSLALEEHSELLDAIASRDPTASREAMRKHMKNAEVRFASGWRSTDEPPR
jgi:DNA-binding FadR family transcriptional regulator